MKQESQRRVRSAVVPERSVVSSTVVQKAGRTDHRAIAAGQAAFGDLVPARMVGVGLQQFLEAVGIEVPSHLAPGSRDDPFGGGELLRGREPVRQALDQISARGAAHLDHEKMTGVVDNLGEGQVETRFDLRSGIHRNAEAGAACLTAIDRDEKGVVAARLIRFVAILAREKYAILDGDRAKFAGANADKGEGLGHFPIFDDREAIAVAMGLPKPLDRRMEKSLPGMRPHGVAEQRSVGTRFDAVSPGLLSIGPSDGEIVEMRDRLVNDGAVANGRADDAITPAPQPYRSFAAEHPARSRAWHRAHPTPPGPLQPPLRRWSFATLQNTSH